MVLRRLTAAIISGRACTPTRPVILLNDLQSPLINHPPVKLINHTAIKMRGHKMKKKAVKVQCNLIKNNNSKKRRKNKTKTLTSGSLYAAWTRQKPSLPNSDACRRRRESINQRGRKHDREWPKRTFGQWQPFRNGDLHCQTF